MNNINLRLEFDEQLDPITYLRSGDLTALYQHGKLRYIRYKGKEVIRMIYTAIRDENWNTAPYEIANENVLQQEDGFVIEYTANYHMNHIRYVAQVKITASNNDIAFYFDGKATSDFKRNRIGICLLHTVDAIRGREVEVNKPDGEKYKKTFPTLISPHQPIKDVRSMNWNFGEAEATVDFEGDVFENEDQRNWTDSSFKTYSTPLDLPLPVQVKTGDRVTQRIKLSIKPSANSSANTATGKSLQKLGAETAFPAFGFCKVKGKMLSREEISALSDILFHHYTVDIHLADPAWINELETAVKEARQLNVLLQLTVYLEGSDVREVPALRQNLESIYHLVESILVVDTKTNRTNNEALNEVYDRLKPQYPAVQIGYGTTNHFADLNRNLPSRVQYDFVSFGITPQAHSTDTISLLENLDNQRDTIETLHSHLGDVEIHVSPVTFKGRKATLFTETTAPPDYDARQHMQLGAAWLIKTLRNFAGNNITLFDVTGYKGVVSDQHWTSGPSPFYNLLKSLKAFQPKYFVNTSLDENEMVLKNDAGDEFVIELDKRYEDYRAFKPQP